VRFFLVPLIILVIVFSASFADEIKTTADHYPYLCSGVLRDALPTSLGDGVIAQCEGLVITQRDLDAQIAKLTGSKKEQARKYPVYILERYLTQRLLLMEAKEWAKKSGRVGNSDDQLVRSYLAANTPKFDVDDAEAEAFYKEHAKMFGGSSFEQVKTSIVCFVRDQKTAEAEDQFTGSAGKRHTILVSDSWLRSEHDRWSKNPVEQARLSGRPTYVNFGVIGCCDKMNPVTQSLRQRYSSDELNVVFIHTGEEEVLSGLYGVKTIPVQFLFDKDGRLLLRHQGYISQDQVIAEFAKHGVELTKGGGGE
jgi:thiol-disulfide isomerase/thioredoxin